ncbi:hypothetical protein GCM10023191_034010 [Actinoallomurus oryzae]|uniref:Uncharacterized protein n=1 Tax=Actinoallomurus oryzae TaxID=502180 RepID=A0ABP8PX54_9ACTN
MTLRLEQECGLWLEGRMPGQDRFGRLPSETVQPAFILSPATAVVAATSTQAPFGSLRRDLRQSRSWLGMAEIPS